MQINRRSFLKLSAASVAGATLAEFGLDLKPAQAHAKMSELRIRYAKKTTTICPYCAVGCGLIVAVEDGKVINVEGDPDHPINQGALCSKGSALYQVANNDQRLTKVLYRAPGGSSWEEKDWDWAIDRIAHNIKATRDANWIDTENDTIVNRTEVIGSLGGSHLDNEECYLIVKAMRALGLVYIEHQARICHSSTVASLAESFGRGAMTNHWIDIKNSDCILVIGSNAAENHPISFKWVTKAMEQGAKLISVDPRFTRTSSKADIYAKMRSGTDVAFIGGMINYVLQNNLYHQEYVAEYTNASFIIDTGFKGPADLDGLFSGYDAAKRNYDKSTWKYQLDSAGIPKMDKTLNNPNSVFQLLKRHFARYDVDTVCNITGTPKDVYLKVCETYAATGRQDKAGTIMYAMGTTQHTHGSQNIRSYAILQLLLGNIGVAGGGINALRGSSNVQGSTDHCLLYHILPGYLKVPINTDSSLARYLERITTTTNDPISANWWGNTPKYVVSLLKAWYGDAATKENNFSFDYLPKTNGGNYSHIALFEAMYADRIKGLILWGQNPVVDGPNANMECQALRNLDWMVAVDLWQTETSLFWKAPGVDPATIKTEVFLLPAASSVEKEGSITNSGRWAQWRYQAVAPPGEAKRDAEIVSRLMLKLRELYAAEGGANPEGITNLTWGYGEHPDVRDVAREINGYDLTTGELLTSFGNLKSDGTTTSGNWLYCGSYTEDGNMMARRDLTDPSGIGLYPKWSWCWPLNRRIIYNRASVDLNGEPWDKEHPVIWWKKGKWVGDVPDGPWPPMAADPEKTKRPFIMKPDGVGHIFGPYMGTWSSSLADGPLPEHYEPWESPINNPMSGIQSNPAFTIWKSEMDYKGSPDRYPIVATTYRVSEHFLTGSMTRNLPWLNELMPEMFVELSEELAQEEGIKNGDKAIVESARGKIEAVAIVTKRFQPFQLNGRIVHQIGFPWHWGYAALAKGAIANTLTPHVGDANTTIPEYKAFLCNIRSA
ncbi:formate dehydrogenase-N subunit alpha [Chloroflexota bacterium]